MQLNWEIIKICICVCICIHVCVYIYNFILYLKCINEHLFTKFDRVIFLT